VFGWAGLWRFEDRGRITGVAAGAGGAPVGCVRATELARCSGAAKFDDDPGPRRGNRTPLHPTGEKKCGGSRSRRLTWLKGLDLN
jgi:hypothetical protein